MARTRFIKPAFFLNEDLAELSCQARLLFIGLWTIADREGRLEDRPRRIKATLFPHEECDIDRLLGSLASKGFVTRYSVNEQRYIAIRNFTKHQKPHPREPASEVPPPLIDECIGPDRSPEDGPGHKPGHGNFRTGHDQEESGHEEVLSDHSSDHEEGQPDRESVMVNHESETPGRVQARTDRERGHISREKDHIGREKASLPKDRKIESHEGRKSREPDRSLPGCDPRPSSHDQDSNPRYHGQGPSTTPHDEGPSTTLHDESSSRTLNSRGTVPAVSGGASASNGLPVRTVFEYWRDKTGRLDAKLTGEREMKIRARLAEGYTLDQLKQAVDGCRSSSFHQGDNDRGHRYDDITLICRSGSK